MEHLMNEDFGVRDAYSTNRHSGAIDCVNNRCVTCKTNVKEMGSELRKTYQEGHKKQRKTIHY
jgi:hypothetical protein